MRKEKQLVIVVPCYNESEIINDTATKLLSKLLNLIEKKLISEDSQICFINDGSSDNTRLILETLCAENSHYALINLTKNYGQQSALMAGIQNIPADIIITIDADLQDDYNSIEEMLKKYHEGYEIVYGCRKNRTTDSIFKKISAELYYTLMNVIGIYMRMNHADFRLMSKFAIEKLCVYAERGIFLRIVTQNIGLKTCEVYYDRQLRMAGNTKYTLSKMLKLAWNGVTSYSNFPLRLILFFGLILILASLCITLAIVLLYCYHYKISHIFIYCTIASFFSGIITFSIGLVGEYLSKILAEVQHRPLYQIEYLKNIKN